MDRRKLVVVSLMGLGLFVMLHCALILISMRMALPPWSFQTEGKYVAYGLSVWMYGLWMIPMGSILVLLGILVYPFSSFRKEILAIPIIFGLGSSAVLVYSGWSIIGHWIESLRFPTPFQILGGFIGMFSPLTVVLILSIFAARKTLRTSGAR
mgnify:CR=1 FL=1